ncbi:hypothetical protein QT381_09755 [Galbitalea sp. SE-J8]|uniref:hypothetical protein n=1 Tax=Galbitalea sp. SE-J8 TaxID=3054952 RepID=UPI00259C754B|nr:hypothetical protein [Galbitalea sp. SE-J8]MDM4763290.1 hypothetical protein [Galbitalea sp. SE-J8]
MAQPVRPHTRWGFTALFGLLGSLIVGVLVLAFLWPVATAEVHDLPVAISGPGAAVQQVEAAIDDATDGAIAWTRVDDRAAAVSSIEARDTSGALVLSTDAAPEVLTASAGGTAATQLLGHVATGLQAQLDAAFAASRAPAGAQPPTVTTTDVVPLSADDPNGSGLTAMSFPLVLGGMIGGILISLLVVGVVRRLVALLVYAAATGLVVGLVTHTWFGILGGSFGLDWLALAVSMLGTASLIVGCTALLGPRGIAIGSVVTMLVANPISGAALPAQFIVGPWGEIGQYFVPGAASTLVRSISYFPSADTAQQWLVLAAWAVGGLVLSVAGHFRSRAPIQLPAVELEPAGAHAA